MAKPGLKVWRSMPKARRQNLKAKGVDTRREKAQFGRQLARSRKQGTAGPTAKGGRQGRGQGRGAGSAATVEEATTGGVAPRGARVERTRKTTTAGGKVGVTRTGGTSGGPGPEAYRQVEPGGGTGKGKGLRRKALGRPKAKGVGGKGRATGAIRKPGKGGPGKRLIAQGGGGRRALATFRALPKAARQSIVGKAKAGTASPKDVVEFIRTARTVVQPKAQPKKKPKR